MYFNNKILNNFEPIDFPASLLHSRPEGPHRSGGRLGRAPGEGRGRRNRRPSHGKRSQMIGMIRFDFRGGMAEAVLGKDGCWSCAAVPCVVHPLDILYSPNWEGLSAGRRHLEEAALWLKGVVVFGADCPIPGTARRSDPGVRADLSDRPSRHPTVPATKRFDRVTARAAARMCRVSPGMIGLWVETGGWPMPRRGGAASATFGLSEVEGWLATGDWPAWAHFQAPPEDAAPPTHLARTSRWMLSETSAESRCHRKSVSVGVSLNDAGGHPRG
jgi:hypothetical protein